MEIRRPMPNQYLISVAGLYEDWEIAPLTLSDSHKDWFTWHHSIITVPPEQQTAESAEPKKAQHSDSCDVALGWAGLAAVQVAEGKWKEIKSSVEKGIILNVHLLQALW